MCTVLYLLHLYCTWQVFPSLYIPVMEEANARVLRPYRKYLPTPAWFAFRSRMAKLNEFLIGFFRERWAARQAGVKRPNFDILDRVMDSIEVCGYQQACPSALVLAGKGESELGSLAVSEVGGKMVSRDPES